MCQYCGGLITAIDRYIAKADSNLSEQLRAEGYADPKGTMSHISNLEDGIAEALTEETDYLVGEIRRCDTLEDVQSSWERITSKDTAGAKISQLTASEFETMMPKTIQYYIQQTDRELKLEQVSQKTMAWVQSWSQQLGQIMQLNSHKEIESILTDGLKSGVGIEEFTRKILESGIRDEYYKARRVAVTEVLRAHSVAQQEALMQSPSVQGKMWRHTGSYRNEPRLNHMDIDGQQVAKAQPVELRGADGGRYYPLDPRDTNLPPGESINCHCLVQPVVDPDVLGMSLEERQALQQQAIDEMDDDWEKELDAANRAKAGIESTLGGTASSLTTSAQKVNREVQRFLSGETSSRQELAEAILQDYGVDGVPVSEVKMTDANGRCWLTQNKDGTLKVTSYQLNSGDTRAKTYQVKTAYHEGYHASANGKKTDMFTMSEAQYKKLEETFAECSAHYKMAEHGITDLAVSYSEQIVDMLPRLKANVPEFAQCSTLADFGKVATEARLAGGGSDWSALYKQAMSTRMNYAKNVTKYFEAIRGDVDGYVDKLLENMPWDERYRNMFRSELTYTMDYVERYQKAPRYSSEKMLLSDAVVIAMNRTGVK